MAMASSLSSATCALSSLSISSSSAPSPSSPSSLSLKSSIFGSVHKCLHATAHPSRQQHQQPYLCSPSASIVLLTEDHEESPEETRRAYEELYGSAFSRLPGKKTDSDEGFGAKARRASRDRAGKDNMEEKVVQIRRVTKVVKGGKQLSFRAIVIVGDKQGRVGVGVGKAKEVITAVQKSAADARRHLVTVPLTKRRTFPHRAEGKYGAAKVMLRPAAVGTGVIAGGSVRVVLELAGVVNALGKELGSKNPLNNARATVEAVSSMMQFSEVAENRGIPMEELWK